MADFIEASGYVDEAGAFWARSQVFVVPLRAGVEQHYDWQRVYPAWNIVYAS